VPEHDTNPTQTQYLPHCMAMNPPSSMQPQHRPRGCLKKKRAAWKQLHAPSPSPPYVQLSKADSINIDSESDIGMLDLWDPHASLKPSKLDGCALDADVEMKDNLPSRGDWEVSTFMVNMMVNLEERDDGEWLPPRL
jgi:hypothetical protein